jgi:hypothetical protein
VATHCQLEAGEASDGEVEAGVIDVSGMNNKVVFHSGSPELKESGIDNTVRQG